MKHLIRGRDQDGQVVQVIYQNGSPELTWKRNRREGQAIVDYATAILRNEVVSFELPSDPESCEYIQTYFPLTRPQMRAIRRETLIVLNGYAQDPRFREEFSKHHNGAQFPENASTLLTEIDLAIAA